MNNSSLALSLPALGSTQVFDLARPALYRVALMGADGQGGSFKPIAENQIFEAAKEYSKKNGLVFETSILRNFISNMVDEEISRWSLDHTIAEIKAYYQK